MNSRSSLGAKLLNVLSAVSLLLLQVDKFDGGDDDRSLERRTFNSESFSPTSVVYTSPCSHGTVEIDLQR